MKLAVILIIICFAVSVHAQSALQDMVKTEQAFSQMAQDQSIRDAFMMYIADDGLLFRPGAVNGKKWMTEHPVPESDKRPVLVWQPAFAGMAVSGDMGFTTGPWEAKADINDVQPQGYGDFVTVWKKQTDGTWRFVVDLGISHPQSGGPLTLWTPAETPKKEFKPVDVPIVRETLMERDRNYAAAVLSHGFPKSYAAYAARTVRLYRANYLPFIGRDASIGQLSKTTGEFKWTPVGGDVSSAGDFGYTHGTYEAGNERGSYVRIWKKQNGQWRIVMDVTNSN
jgi:ketosteroid isomerase-like protein